MEIGGIEYKELLYNNFKEKLLIKYYQQSIKIYPINTKKYKINKNDFKFFLLFFYSFI